jgi:hypothetical protein
MNKELIRYLAITGGIYDCICDPYDKLKNGDHHSSVMIDLERFAEKIVRECLKIVEPDRTSGDEWCLTLDETAQSIRQHFGIEE